MRKKPDYHVVARNSATLEEGPIGAAWRKPDGSIQISLSPFTQLTASPSLELLLLPRERQATTNHTSTTVTAVTNDPPESFVDYGDLDDINLPF